MFPVSCSCGSFFHETEHSKHSVSHDLSRDTRTLSTGRWHLLEPRTSALLTQPSCGTFGQQRLCNLARHTSSMHVLRAEVLADSSRSAFQVGKPSQSPRRHAEIVPESASRRHWSFRFSHIMRVPCCHVAPPYHVTLLPDLQLPCLKTAYAFCTQISRHFCVSMSLSITIRTYVRTAIPLSSSLWRRRTWRISTVLYARTDSALDDRFQDQTKRERVCMTNPRAIHDRRRAEGSTSCKKPNSPTGAVNKW